MNNFYIYVYLDSRNPGKHCYDNICFLYEPIYIGKGKDKRYKSLSKNKRNKYFIRKINKIKQSGLEPFVFKLYENLNEQQSFELEIKLIKEIGRVDLKTGVLVNMTDGGEGISGQVFSDEHKIKMSNSVIGVKNHFFGKHHSKKTKMKMSQIRKNKFINGELNLKGEKHYLSKLKDNEVWLIKKILDSNYYKSGKITQKFISKMFNVTQETISLIKTGKIWSHIKLGEN